MTYLLILRKFMPICNTHEPNPKYKTFRMGHKLNFKRINDLFLQRKISCIKLANYSVHWAKKLYKTTYRVSQKANITKVNYRYGGSIPVYIRHFAHYDFWRYIWKLSQWFSHFVYGFWWLFWRNRQSTSKECFI